MNVPLLPRQAALFKDVCDVLRVSTNVEGEIEDFAVLGRGIPYWHGPTRNLQEPTDAGRQIEQNIFTVDEAHFSSAMFLLPSDGYVVNRTPGSLKNGKFFRFEGPPRILDSPGIRHIHGQFVDLRWDEQPHPDLVAVAG